MFRDKTLAYSKIFTVIKLVKQLNNKFKTSQTIDIKPFKLVCSVQIERCP